MHSEKNQSAASETLQEALQLERQAQQYLSEQKHELAYETNRRAAVLFQEIGKPDQAGFCFTLAASCWNKHIGQHPAAKAADAHEQAGKAFLKAHDYHSAMLRFADAAMLHEKEGEASRFSYCFYASKRAKGRDAWNVFFTGRGLTGNFLHRIQQRVLNLFSWKLNVLNRLLWGYGEKPFRTLAAAALLIFFCAVIYTISGPFQSPGAPTPHSITFWEGLYFSIVTFSTVGYGDYLALGAATRITAGAEALSGMMLMPLFLIGLTRRYLRAAF